MSNEALILMIAAEGIITVVTVYFFYKVLTVPPKPEPDSYSENDDD
ncbi:MAG: hypothetical protein ACK560_10050 [Bacteroidota bacterium]|jgi:hypothetical protein